MVGGGRPGVSVWSRRVERPGAAGCRLLRSQYGAPDPLSAALLRTVFSVDRGDLGSRAGLGSPVGQTPYHRASVIGDLVRQAVRSPRFRDRAAGLAFDGDAAMGQSARQFYVRAGHGAVARNGGHALAGTTHSGSPALGSLRFARGHRLVGDTEWRRRFCRAVPANDDADAASLFQRMDESELPISPASRNLVARDDGLGVHYRYQAAGPAAVAVGGALSHGAHACAARRTSRA